MTHRSCLLGVFLLALAPVGTGVSTPHRTVHQWEEVKAVILTWAHGVASADSAQVATVLHESYPNRDRYLRGIAQRRPGVRHVVIRYARHEVVNDTVRVSPVVAIQDRRTRKTPLTLSLVSVRGAWQITRIARAPELPKAMTVALPEHSPRFSVAVSVRDAETGEPIATRVHVAARDGEYWPPEGRMKYIALGWRDDVGGDVMVGDKTFAYVEPNFIVPLAEGSYDIEVARGLEYEPQTVQLEVSESNVPTVDVRLRRWSNVREQGWYSGDTHVHFLDPRTAFLELRGEDLQVVNILATKWGELITNVEHFIGAPSTLSGSDEVVYVNEESRHGFLGHTILLNLKELVYPLAWGSQRPGVGGSDYPPMAHQADKAHAQGGFVSWAHFPGPSGEVAIDIALGKIDAVDLMTWGDAFRESGRAPPARTWYRFLNVGFDVPATAGTDKMANTQVVGSVRTYAKIDGPFTYQKWIDGMRAGRTFVTTGPMLTFNAGGRALGETIEANAGDMIPVRAAVRSRLPVDRIEIVAGGEVIAAKENAEHARDLAFETEVRVERSTWIAARAYSSHVLPLNRTPVMAHTSPVYVEVDRQPRRSPEDAAFLMEWTDQAIEWAKTRAHFHSDAEREEMIALFMRARAIYQEQIGATGQ